MKNTLKALPIAALALLLSASLARAQLGSGTATTSLTVVVGAEAGLTAGTTPNLASTGTNFGSYTTSTTLTYYIRTASSGSITLKVTSDFSPANGPSVGTPPTAGDALTYTTSGQQPGGGGSGGATYFASAQTATTTSQTNVATFGADARSVFAGNTATVAWTLTNDPKYKIGTYSATITFTISAS